MKFVQDLTLGLCLFSRANELNMVGEFSCFRFERWLLLVILLVLASVSSRGNNDDDDVMIMITN